MHYDCANLVAIVPETQVGIYLEHVGSNVKLAYETVGLIAVSLSRRQVLGYVEFLTLSIWQSDEALKRFLEGQLASTGVGSDGGSFMWNRVLSNSSCPAKASSDLP